MTAPERITALPFPQYLPDATRGVVRGLSIADLKTVGAQGVVVNTYHLIEQPGKAFLSEHSGVKGFMNWDGFVVSDSGGWQIFSLIHRSKTGGSITDAGVVFELGPQKKELFTPEQSLENQKVLQSDIMVCLDDFTPPDADPARVAESVDRTILWGNRSKDWYTAQKEQGLLPHEPLLFAPIHGGWDNDERKRCAEGLFASDFDGYGYGGYIIRDDGTLDYDMMAYLAELIPGGKYRFALGVGRPWDIARCALMGWHFFDCTLPTRDARHHRLYTFVDMPTTAEEAADKARYAYLYINRGSNVADNRPVEDGCPCELCTTYSRAYLYHLFSIGDTLAYRLASLHNLTHYYRLINLLQKDPHVQEKMTA